MSLDFRKNIHNTVSRQSPSPIHFRHNSALFYQMWDINYISFLFLCKGATIQAPIVPPSSFIWEFFHLKSDILVSDQLWNFSLELSKSNKPPIFPQNTIKPLEIIFCRKFLPQGFMCSFLSIAQNATSAESVRECLSLSNQTKSDYCPRISKCLPNGEMATLYKGLYTVIKSRRTSS